MFDSRLCIVDVHSRVQEYNYQDMNYYHCANYLKFFSDRYIVGLVAWLSNLYVYLLFIYLFIHICILM